MDSLQIGREATLLSLVRRLSQRLGQYRFEWLPAISCLLLFVVLVKLGFWQVYRYHYKSDLVKQFHQRRVDAPVPLVQLPLDQDNRFRHIAVKGQFIAELTFYLQNRFFHNRVGYEVITPFKVSGSDKILLINRGWVAQQTEHSQALPGKQPVSQELALTGYIKILDNYVFTLGANQITSPQGDTLVQKIDIDALIERYHWQLYPFVMRLDKREPFGFVRAWQPTSSDPARSLGYAVQWFAMALVLVLAYLGFSTRYSGGQ